MIRERLARYAQGLPRQSRGIFLTCVFGLGAGGVAVAFAVAINWLYQRTFVQLSQRPPLEFILGSLAVILVSSLLVGWLLNQFAPSAAGSGIPQHKLAFWKDFGFVSWRLVWVKFVGGVISIGGGASLGREGPTVQLAGGLASNLAGMFGVAKQQRRLAAAAGAAAGLAAAFNTPVAAVTFVLEEIIGDLNSRLLGSVLLASVIGALVVQGVMGPQPAFVVGAVAAPGWRVYGLTPVVASLAALVGALFQRGAMGLRGWQKTSHQIPGWLQPALGGLIAWALGTVVFLQTGHLGVFSLGYGDLTAGLNHQLGWKIAAVLLVAKLAATVACYGLGGCGGIFSPTLFLGCMCGLTLAGVCSVMTAMSGPEELALAVVGMSACLGAVVRAPVTGILIVFEMTHEFSLVPALMVGALVSQTVSRRLNRHSFYDEVLRQDGQNLERLIPPRDLRSWQQLPVSSLANFQPVCVPSGTPAELRPLLERYAYKRFPVLQNGAPVGVILREEAQKALAESRAARWEPVVTCLPQDSVREVQGMLVESNALLAVVLDKADGKAIGLVTLHDLLRAQTALAESGVE